MRNPLSGMAIAVIAAVAIALAWMSIFVVDPTEQALILRFGQPVRDLIGAPGLYFKWPFVDTVVYIDKRILALDSEPQEVLVSDNQRLEVDAYIRYRIADPLLFYQSVFNTRGADAQLGGTALEKDAPIMEVTTRAPPRGRTRRLARGFNLAPCTSWITRGVMDHSGRNPHMSKEIRRDRTRQRRVKKLQIGHRFGPI